MEENMKARKPLLAALLICALALVACTIPAWVNTVEADAEIAVPIAASSIDVIDPALAPLVSLIEGGFNALVKTLDTYKASPTATNLQEVQSAFDAVNSNVAQLESSAQIKNPATKTTVTQVVQLLTQAVTEIAALVPASASSNLKLQIPNSGSRIPKGWKARDFKKQFNSIVKDDPRFKPLK
jgi:hypothetical protein